MEPEIQIPQLPFFLIGFMACGKSTTGEALAAKLGRSFIDLDKQIEALTEQTIADLIEQEGVARFRQIETEALRKVAHAPAVVIALGGGAMTRPENRQLMERAGLTVWLDAPFEVCWQRIQNDNIVRPLAPTEDEARARYVKRLPLYNQAKIRIKVNASQSTDDLVEAIIRQLVIDKPGKPQSAD